MHISALYRLMGGDGHNMYTELRKLSKKEQINEGVKQYDPKLHKVKDKGKRPDKVIFVPNGQKDPITGADILIEDSSPVSRVPVSFENYIIGQKATFAAGSGITLKPSDEGTKLFGYVERNWYDNKTDFHIRDIFRQVMAYTEAAVIFYGERGAENFDEFRYKMKVVSPENGDVLEPFFDEDGNLISFGREYKVNDKSRYDFYIIGESKLVEIRRFEDGKLMTFDTDTDEPTEVLITKYTKLPIVYWSQDEPECHITEEMREEFEASFSDFLTQMGYSADPILFGKGSVLNLPAKGSAGKFIEGSADSDLKFITPDNATESRELQFSLLQKFIFGLNRAVFLDMETMKELGDVSGAALERYLMDAYMEASGKQQGYLGMGVQRMVNWLTHTWRGLVGGEKNLRIYINFNKLSMTSQADMVDLAMKANGGLPVMTHEASISLAGLEEDSSKALKEITSQVSVVPVQ